MNSFGAYLRKEIKEGIRSYKYLILAVGILFFAIANPIIMKMLPTIIKSQMDMDISQLMKITQSSTVMNYAGDLFEIGNIVVVLALMGILADEVREKLLAMPFSKGASAAGIVLSKTISYIAVISVLIMVGYFINYYHASILFAEDPVTLGQVAVSAALLCIYFAFNVSLIVFTSSIFKSGIAAALSALPIIYFMPLLYKINAFKPFLPYAFLENAMMNFMGPISLEWVSVLTTAALIVILNLGAIVVIKRKEVV